jgi:ribose/xylose/arabinose/galactoside ABC-type transport system permease subunit
MVSEPVVYFLILTILLLLGVGPLSRFIGAGSAHHVTAEPLFAAAEQFSMLTMYVLCPAIVIMSGLIDVRYARAVSFVGAILLAAPAAAIAGYPSLARSIVLMIAYAMLGLVIEYTVIRYRGNVSRIT